MQASVRAEPLGVDRHWRRYHWLSSARGQIFVEEPEGAAVGIIASAGDLEALVAGLNPAGTRERALLAELRKHGQARALFWVSGFQGFEGLRAVRGQAAG